MSLHNDWDDVIEDLLGAISLPSSIYNVYESISQKHSNSKIVVRCGACVGLIGLTIRHFQTHHFQKGKKPEVTVKCPHCQTTNTQHDMDYHGLE